MKHARSIVLIVILLSLASCGGTGDGGVQGMDGGQNTRTGENTAGGTTSMGEDAMARGMLSDANGEYSDVRFVDAMVPHHEGAITMAQVALDNAEHEEISNLARDIISAQEAEIRTLNDIRAGLDGAPTRMDGDMTMMEMTDPGELARQRPFDRAFIDAMIPHHESAISMARVALSESENDRIKALARDIISAQEREIEQMRTWRERWYPEG